VAGRLSAFAVGHKAPWWEVVAAGQGEEAREAADQELQAQLQELAGESLSLLRAALRDDRFPQLFDLQVRGAAGSSGAGDMALTHHMRPK